MESTGGWRRLSFGLGNPGFQRTERIVVNVAIYAGFLAGAQRAAMYFGVQGFLTQWVFGASGAVLAYLFARFGHSAEAPLGVMLVGPVAAVACGVSVWLYARYPETEVLSEIHRSSQER